MLLTIQFSKKANPNVQQQRYCFYNFSFASIDYSATFSIFITEAAALLSPVSISFQECSASFRQMHIPEAHVHLVQAKIRLKVEKWIPQQFTYHCSNNG